ncbi:hypothetical protein IHQ68_08830 [Chelatococcus sambhunathii]|uniref:Protein ImuA n=1 Tax=Chelatococcus sambhunathii TaxID=363953 RepID=A0ABU1DF26_9HYPH|nr:hypothetical protein [Chelatococcus sambhunathii]MDR4306721.1 hypothetical protein [Chelatococcus sambhunathii]
MPDLSALRRAISALERSSACERGDLFGFGAPEIDGALGGGIRRGALHEVYARKETDSAAASGFGLCLALRAARDRPLVWARQDFLDLETGALHGAGIAAFGGDPAKILVVRPGDAAGVLRAAGEAARCPAIGAALLEVWGAPKTLDLKASRRLGLASEKSGVTLVMIRRAAAPEPSAAQSRWSVAAAVSTALQDNAPGRPAFDIELLRHRSGLPPRAFRLEWDRDSLSFAAAPLSRSVAAVPADRPARPAGGGLRRRAG